MLMENALLYLRDLDFPIRDIPTYSASALVLHAPEMNAAGASNNIEALTRYGIRSAHLYSESGAIKHYPDGAPSASADGLLSSKSAVLLIHDPLTTDSAQLERYRAWLARSLRHCVRLHDANDMVIDMFLRREFPCDLKVEDNEFTVEYENGSRLGGLVPYARERHIDLHILWTDLPSEPHAYSVQIFDEESNMVLGHDRVIGDKPLAHDRVDLGSLPSGDYTVRLILYNSETGVSVPGTLVGSGERVERTLDIGRVTID